MASSASKQTPRRPLTPGDLARLRLQGPRLLRWYEAEAPAWYRARLLRSLPTIILALFGACLLGWAPVVLLLFLQLDAVGRLLADLVLLLDPEHRQGSRWDRLHAARDHAARVLASLARKRASVECHAFGSAHWAQHLAVAWLLAICFALPWGLLSGTHSLAELWALPGLRLAVALGAFCIAGHLGGALWTVQRSALGRQPVGGPDLRAFGFLLWVPVLLLLSNRTQALLGGVEPAGLLLASARVEIALLLLVALPLLAWTIAVAIAGRRATELRRGLQPDALAAAAECLQQPDPRLDPTDPAPLRELNGEDLARLREEGPGVLAYYRAGATRATHELGVACLVGALVPLLGVLLFGWSPAVLLLLIAVDWVGLWLADCLRFAGAADACVAQDAAEDVERRSSHRLEALDQTGWVPREAKALPPSRGRSVLMLALLGLFLLPLALAMVWFVVLFSHHAGSSASIDPLAVPAGLVGGSLLLAMALVLIARVLEGADAVRRGRNAAGPQVGLALSSIYLMAVPFAMIPLFIGLVVSDAGGTAYMAAATLLAFAAGRAAFGVGWLLRARDQQQRLVAFLALGAQQQARRLEDALRGASAPLPD